MSYGNYVREGGVREVERTWKGRKKYQVTSGLERQVAGPHAGCTM